MQDLGREHVNVTVFPLVITGCPVANPGKSDFSHRAEVVETELVATHLLDFHAQPTHLRKRWAGSDEGGSG